MHGLLKMLNFLFMYFEFYTTVDRETHKLNVGEIY